MIVCHVDGLCEPINPGGVATYGYVIYRGEEEEKIAEGCGVVNHPSPSNNVAEYTACIKCLEKLLELGFEGEEIVVRSDSQLLIYQLTGYYSVNASRIIPLYRKAVRLAEEFEDLTFEWHPRELNEDADELSRKAYAEYVEQHPEFYQKYGKYLATEKQKAFLDRLKAEYPPWISKREASMLIDSVLREKKQKKRL